jgi:hypothetical protein
MLDYWQRPLEDLENMNRKTIPSYQTLEFYLLTGLPALVFWTLLILCSDGAFAQTASGTTDTTSSIRATHLIGFEGAPNNANGNLSIQNDVLRFERDGKPAVQVSIASIQNVSLGEQSREVGGTPMTLGKAATPFGGGRAVSLFAHKKYDTLALEYVDASGGLHGAVFQLNKGQGDVLRSRLLTKGAHVSVVGGGNDKQ